MNVGRENARIGEETEREGRFGVGEKKNACVGEEIIRGKESFVSVGRKNA